MKPRYVILKSKNPAIFHGAFKAPEKSDGKLVFRHRPETGNPHLTLSRNRWKSRLLDSKVLSARPAEDLSVATAGFINVVW